MRSRIVKPPVDFRLASCGANIETMAIMTINDALIHPALLDPRQWADVDLYDATVNIEREAITGDEHHTPDRKISIKHLKLDLRFDYERRRVEGVATFTLSPINDGLAHFELDIAEMEIKRVTLTSIKEESAISRRLEFETRPEKLEIELDRPYARDEPLTIEVEYSCSPRKGLFFVEPDEAYPNKPRQIWSQGENEDAHWWFPCQDVTNQKMTTEMIATVKSDFFALSNGELAGVLEHNGERTYHWRQTQPAPAYLLTIVIGEYQALDDD